MLDAMILLEVMDKEWPLSLVVLLFSGLGVLGFALSHRRPLAAVFVEAVVILGGIRQILELNDPFVGPAIRSEAGLSYILLSYASISVGVLLPLFGACCGFAKRKRQRESTGF